MQLYVVTQDLASSHEERDSHFPHSVASRQSSPAGFGCQGPSYISLKGRWTFRLCGVQTCTSPTRTNTRGPHSSGPWLALGYQCVKTPMSVSRWTQSCKAFALGQGGPTEVMRRAVCLLSKQQSLHACSFHHTGPRADTSGLMKMPGSSL